jgi:ABC-type polysaccharide/polyol phosphate transport system ATPase subunit
LQQFIDHSNILLLATHNERLMKDMCNSQLNLATGEISAL